MAADQRIFDDQPGDWQDRLAVTVSVMRELSLYTDPRAMQEVYTRRMVELFPVTRLISLSRRDMLAPHARITRYNLWEERIDPWADKDRHPVISGGILSRLIYGDQPVVLDDLDLDPSDPAAPFLEGQRSLMAIPHYEQGRAVNMVVLTRAEANAFHRDRFPDIVWMSNLFGRATQASRLSDELQKSYAVAEHEMQMVARMQQSLLPSELPSIPTLDLAVHYQSMQKAGGDYYDFFELPKNRWGILIADVSGHGTSAAVLMSITHSLVKTYSGPPFPPGLLLSYINHHLATHYTQNFGAFVTAMYAIYDPAKATLSFANAGHNPARLIRPFDGSRKSLGGKRRLPLGIHPEEEYPETTVQLVPGDQVIFYTDGITEATDADGEMFGPERLDAVLAASPVGAGSMVESVLSALHRHTAGQPIKDDRTLLAMKFGTVTAALPLPKRSAEPAVLPFVMPETSQTLGIR